MPLWCCLVGGLGAGGYIARFLSHPTLLLMGNASYATYILQAPLHSYFRAAGMLTHRDIFGTEFHNLVPAAVFLAMLLISSVVAHEAIEIPGRKLILSIGQKSPALAPA
jgi:peptidoglycan/LPS O-acetylase OafA/YrhL